MATKTKAAGAVNNTADTAETVIHNGAEAMKDGLEKAVRTYDHFLTFGKGTVEAYLKAAHAAGKGFETFHAEWFAFAKQSVEDSVAATKAVLGSRSVHEAIEHQTGFAKTTFETYVGEVNRLNEIAVSTAKETFEPIQGRVQAWVDVVQTARAA